MYKEKFGEVKAHPTDDVRIKKVQKQLPSGYILEDMAQFFNMLADPTRLKIVVALKSGELCVHEISEIVDLSVSAVSHQLRLLKTTKLVRNRREGKHIYYNLDDNHISELLLLANTHVKEEI
jgi:ArsR family transcriptional regulator